MDYKLTTMTSKEVERENINKVETERTKNMGARNREQVEGDVKKEISSHNSHELCLCEA